MCDCARLQGALEYARRRVEDLETLLRKRTLERDRLRENLKKQVNVKRNMRMRLLNRIEAAEKRVRELEEAARRSGRASASAAPSYGDSGRS